MKQYPIWNEVITPDYKNSFGKSFGSRSYTKTTVKIGSSSRNSWEFLTHETRGRDRDDGSRVFEFLVNGKIIVECAYNPKSKEDPIYTYLAPLYVHTEEEEYNAAYESGLIDS